MATTDKQDEQYPQFAGRADIGDDPETLRMIKESRERAEKRTTRYHAQQAELRKQRDKKAGPGAAAGSTGR
jgi:hypothetical protein